jgi:4a-hydroxytetrahydrobiopterin dehydratase
MSGLADKTCIACSGKTPKLSAQQVAEHLSQVTGWSVTDSHLTKKWKFRDFAEALTRVHAIGVIAESEGHHPDIRFGWGYLEVSLSTHSIGGLSENDFILAAKIDALAR